MGCKAGALLLGRAFLRGAGCAVLVVELGRLRLVAGFAAGGEDGAVVVVLDWSLACSCFQLEERLLAFMTRHVEVCSWSSCAVR